MTPFNEATIRMQKTAAWDRIDILLKGYSEHTNIHANTVKNTEILWQINDEFRIINKKIVEMEKLEAEREAYLIPEFLR